MNITVETIALNTPEDHYPAAVVRATALAAAAEQLIATVNAETEPTFDDATPKTIEKTFTQMVEWRRDRDTRLRVATEIHDRATAAIGTAWETSTFGLTPYFREEYDAAAARLRDIVDTLGIETAGTLITEALNPASLPLRTTVERLRTLSQVRDSYAHLEARTDLVSDVFTRTTRLVTFDSRDAYKAFIRFMPARLTAEFFFHALTTPGATLRWSDRNEQIALEERLYGTAKV